MVLASHGGMELAGMVDENGLLGRPSLPVRRPWASLRNRIEGGRLFYSWPGDPHPNEDVVWTSADGQLTKRVDPRGALDAFVRIRSERNVLAFAEKYGPLLLCDCGNPWEEDATFRACEGCGGYADMGGEASEPVARWFGWVEAANKLLDAAAQLHTGGASPPMSGAELAESVSTWLAYGNVRPEVEWSARTPVFQFGTETFGLIGIQLMTAITRAHSVAVCSGCGVPYLPTRKPRADRRNFCEQCGEREANRLRTSRYRARKRAQVQSPLRKGKRDDE